MGELWYFSKPELTHLSISIPSKCSRNASTARVGPMIKLKGALDALAIVGWLRKALRRLSIRSCRRAVGRTAIGIGEMMIRGRDGSFVKQNLEVYSISPASIAWLEIIRTHSSKRLPSSSLPLHTANHTPSVPAGLYSMSSVCPSTISSLQLRSYTSSSERAAKKSFAEPYDCTRHFAFGAPAWKIEGRIGSTNGCIGSRSGIS